MANKDQVIRLLDREISLKVANVDREFDSPIEAVEDKLEAIRQNVRAEIKATIEKMFKDSALAVNGDMFERGYSSLKYGMSYKYTRTNRSYQHYDSRGWGDRAWGSSTSPQKMENKPTISLPAPPEYYVLVKEKEALEKKKFDRKNVIRDAGYAVQRDIVLHGLDAELMKVVNSFIKGVK